MCNDAVMRAALNGPRRLVGRRALLATGIASGSMVARLRVQVVRAGAQSVPEVIDLTHALSAGFPVYPGYTPFSSEITSTIDGIGSLSRVVSMEEHVGTHVDAPAHFVDDGDDVASIPAGRLVAPLAVIDISGRVAGNVDTTVGLDDLTEWEERYGAIPNGAFVAMFSGWDGRVDDPDDYLNIGADGLLHFPAWSPEAATFLVDERKVVGLGVDTISLDNTTSPTFEAHRALLGAGGYGVENLANLGEVPAAGATVVVGAPSFSGGSGGPARVLALV